MLKIKSDIKFKKSGLPSFVLLLELVLGLFSCSNKETVPDVSSIKVQLNIHRLDTDLEHIDTNDIAGGLQKLQQKYPDFLNFYLDTLMGFGVRGNYENQNPGINVGLRSYLTYKDYRGVFDTIAKHYPDTRDIDEQLTKGYSYMIYYLPETKPRDIIYLLSWLGNWAAFTYDDKLCIGLDMFLGAGYPYYRSVGIPEYMSVQMDRKYIPVAAFRALYQDMHPFVMEDRNLLNMMIQRGKEAYFISKVLPFIPEHTRLGYTEEQLQWCNENEALVYNFFVKENMLYATDWQRILRYIKEGPNSTGMPPQSPGNIGTWLGLQIVKSYMDKHAKTSMQDLLKMKIEEQQFLQQSKYKPR